MTRKRKKENINTIQTRLEDAKSQYNDNQNMIELLKSHIDEAEDLNVHACNGTISIIPEFKQWQDLVKTNITLRKQINDMEILLRGISFEEDEADPFA